jgi:hypothetical protein
VSCCWYRRHRMLWRQWWIWPSSPSHRREILSTVQGTITVILIYKWHCGCARRHWSTQEVWLPQRRKRFTATSVGILTNTQTVFLEKDNSLRLTEAVTEKTVYCRRDLTFLCCDAF